MRTIYIASATLLAVLALNAPASARGLNPATMGRIITYGPADGGADMPTVNRGAPFTIACGDIDKFASDVRVVLSLANSDKPTGYEAVLATDQKVGHGNVQVRMPDAPGIANHVVNVTVYTIGKNGAHACDAGKMRIV